MRARRSSEIGVVNSWLWLNRGFGSFWLQRLSNELGKSSKLTIYDEQNWIDFQGSGPKWLPSRTEKGENTDLGHFGCSRDSPIARSGEFTPISCKSPKHSDASSLRPDAFVCLMISPKWPFSLSHDSLGAIWVILAAAAIDGI